PARRLLQAQAAAKLGESADMPTILCGDFNDVPGSQALGLFDSGWTAVPKKDPAFTWPAGKPREQIDHMFVRGFTPAGLLLILPEAVASDHRPMVAEFLAK